jgi:aminoglycoside/choline kinase family phosphotransferase
VTDRATLRRQFVAAAGWHDAEVTALPGDASFRRYFRLTRPGASAMLMDAPPPQEDVRPFQRIARLLLELDLSAPRILAADLEAGFLLLEDFGDATYTRLLAGGGAEAGLYRIAGDTLAALHRRFDPAAATGIAPYDDAVFLREASLLPDWFLPEAMGTPTEDALRTDYLDRWAAVLPLARAVPETLVLRDYHVDNLMLLPDRQGPRACGLLDFQDALIGPVTYDIVSLIEDARRDVAPDVAAAVRARYLDAFPGIDPEAFGRSLAILGAQRHAKVIGIFCRLMRRDGKPVYLRHLPRLWRLLERSLAHPDLATVRDWFAATIPAAARGIPASFGVTRFGVASLGVKG